MTIYLDNSATTFPKPESVYRVVDHAFRTYGANPGRGGHRMSLESARMVFDARETVADFIDTDDASRVVFTSGATEAINLALFGLLRPGDRVVTTSMEHNAVIRPLHSLQKRGVEVVTVEAEADGLVSVDRIEAACTSGTRLVVMTHCSNVTGTVQDIDAVSAICKKVKARFLVDAAQSAGILPLSVSRSGIDLLAVAGHKSLLGPPGTGFLYIAPDLELEPLIYGGTGTQSRSAELPKEMPERFESGTLNTPGIAGLQAGINYLQETGLEAVRAGEKKLISALVDGLRALERVEVYGPENFEQHGGAVSFNCADLDPAEVGYRLDHEFDIMVRVGLHCAPDAHRTIRTFPRGTVRVSPGCFNTVGDIDRLLSSVKEIAG